MDVVYLLIVFGVTAITLGPLLYVLALLCYEIFNERK